MKQKYRVTLPVEIDGKIYDFGAVVELELVEAEPYLHALIAVEEPEPLPDGRGSVTVVTAADGAQTVEDEDNGRNR